MHGGTSENGPCEPLTAICEHATRNMSFVAIGEVVLVKDVRNLYPVVGATHLRGHTEKWRDKDSWEMPNQ